MKKSIKLIFCRKKWHRNLWFFSHEKSSKSLKKMFFKKKSIQLICADIIFKTECRNLFEINGSQDISILMILQFWKIVLLHKIINKISLTKKQENSAHCFGDNYLTDHLIKFLQDRIKPWRVGALRVCTGYHFFLTKIVREDFRTSFNFSHGSC